MSDALLEQLQARFGLDSFRPSQREVIEAVIDRRDVLCVMPTGAGKSLCYQLPATVVGGLTIVVSPLIALMEDQVAQLRDEGINATYLNSSLTAAMQREALSQIEQGFEGLLYVAPERFFAPSFAALLPRLQPRFLAIDEAHCISQWGHDFRPEYQRLGWVRQQLGNPPCIALTATATHDVRADIVQGLNLADPQITVTGFDRPNLSYQSRRVAKVAEKSDVLLELLRGEPGSAIIYCATRKTVDAIAPLLAQRMPGRIVAPYHAGMDAAARSQNQERFMQAAGAIAVATNAFGMGINKPDIRLVIHQNVPSTLEQYYQEAGRAGRDGLPARCVILFNYQDRQVQDFFIGLIGKDRSDLAAAEIERLQIRARGKLDEVIRYAQTNVCRRQQILRYFGDSAAIYNCACDVCAPDQSTQPLPIHAEVSGETTLLIRQLLSGVARVNGKFGVVVVADVLAGSEDERILRWSLHQLSVHGLLRDLPAKRLIAMLHRLIESGLVRQRDVGEGGRPIYVVELTTVGVAVMRGTQEPPLSLADLRRAAGTGATRRTGGAAAAPEQMDSLAERRFSTLRSARSELARTHDLPAYCICHDSTLKQIAIHDPADLQSLEQVKGMGPRRVQLYGPRLLEALREA